MHNLQAQDGSSSRISEKVTIGVGATSSEETSRRKSAREDSREKRSSAEVSRREPRGAVGSRAGLGSQDESMEADERKRQLESQEPVGGDIEGAKSSKLKDVRLTEDENKTSKRTVEVDLEELGSNVVFGDLSTHRVAQQEQCQVAQMEQRRAWTNGQRNWLSTAWSVPRRQEDLS